MSVLSLHELCRRELRALLDARFMRGGWNREGDRKAAVKFNEVHKLLEAHLAGVEDYLLPYPERSKLVTQLAIAASERTFQEMVEKYVSLLSQLPMPDQSDAYAAAELRKRLGYLERVRGELTNSRQRLAETVGTSGVRGVDFTEILAQLDDALTKTNAEYTQAESILAAYEEVL